MKIPNPRTPEQYAANKSRYTNKSYEDCIAEYRRIGKRLTEIIKERNLTQRLDEAGITTFEKVEGLVMGVGQPVFTVQGFYDLVNNIIKSYDDHYEGIADTYGVDQGELADIIIAVNERVGDEYCRLERQIRKFTIDMAKTIPYNP
jgi:hypothetical protein